MVGLSLITAVDDAIDSLDIVAHVQPVSPIRAVAVNEDLGSTPELLNQDPYAKGWMFKIKISDPGELNDLLSPDDYAHHIGA